MPFDPSKPFEVIETPEAKKPPFDATKPFEPVPESAPEASTKPAFDPAKPHSAVTPKELADDPDFDPIAYLAQNPHDPTTAEEVAWLKYQQPATISGALHSTGKFLSGLKTGITEGIPSMVRGFAKGASNVVQNVGASFQGKDQSDPDVARRMRENAAGVELGVTAAAKMIDSLGEKTKRAILPKGEDAGGITRKDIIDHLHNQAALMRQMEEQGRGAISTDEPDVNGFTKAIVPTLPQPVFKTEQERKDFEQNIQDISQGPGDPTNIPIIGEVLAPGKIAASVAGHTLKAAGGLAESAGASIARGVEKVAKSKAAKISTPSGLALDVALTGGAHTAAVATGAAGAGATWAGGKMLGGIGRLTKESGEEILGAAPQRGQSFYRKAVKEGIKGGGIGVTAAAPMMLGAENPEEAGAMLGPGAALGASLGTLHGAVKGRAIERQAHFSAMVQDGQNASFATPEEANMDASLMSKLSKPAQDLVNYYRGFFQGAVGPDGSPVRVVPVDEATFINETGQNSAGVALKDGRLLIKVGAETPEGFAPKTAEQISQVLAHEGKHSMDEAIKLSQPELHKQLTDAIRNRFTKGDTASKSFLEWIQGQMQAHLDNLIAANATPEQIDAALAGKDLNYWLNEASADIGQGLVTGQDMGEFLLPQSLVERVWDGVKDFASKNGVNIPSPADAKTGALDLPSAQAATRAVRQQLYAQGAEARARLEAREKRRSANSIENRMREIAPIASRAVTPETTMEELEAIRSAQREVAELTRAMQPEGGATATAPQTPVTGPTNVPFPDAAIVDDAVRALGVMGINKTRAYALLRQASNAHGSPIPDAGHLVAAAFRIHGGGEITPGEFLANPAAAAAPIATPTGPAATFRDETGAERVITGQSNAPARVGDIVITREGEIRRVTRAIGDTVDTARPIDPLNARGTKTHKPGDFAVVTHDYAEPNAPTIPGIPARPEAPATGNPTPAVAPTPVPNAPAATVAVRTATALGESSVSEGALDRVPGNPQLSTNLGVADPVIAESGRQVQIPGQRSSRPSSSESPSTEGMPNGVGGSSKPFSDLLQSESFVSQGLSGLDTPSQRIVLSGMLGATQNPKVLNAVVGSLPVDVMNYFLGRQISPEMALHDESVLKNLFSAPDRQNPIALSVGERKGMVNEIATALAEDIDPLGVPSSTSFEGGSAMGAGEGSGVGDLGHETVLTDNKSVGNNKARIDALMNTVQAKVEGELAGNNRIKEKGRKERINAAKLDALATELGDDPNALHIETQADGTRVITGDFEPGNAIHEAIAEIGGGLTPAGIDNLVKMQQAKETPVYIRYRSALSGTEGEGGAGTADLGMDTRSAEYAQDPAATRKEGTIQHKVIIPLGTEVTSTGKIISRFFTVDNLLHNAASIFEGLKAIGKENPYGKTVDEQQAQLVADANAYAANHAHGWRGDGSGPMAGFPDSGFPAADPTWTPQEIPRDRFDVLNMAMHSDRASKLGDLTAEVEAKRQRVAEAKTDKERAQRQGVLERTVERHRKSEEAYNLADFNQRWVDHNSGETNRLRAEMRAQGFDTSVQFKSPFETLSPDHILDISETPIPLQEGDVPSVRPSGMDVDPASMVRSGRPNDRAVASGFMPETGDRMTRQAVKSLSEETGTAFMPDKQAPDESSQGEMLAREAQQAGIVLSSAALKGLIMENPATMDRIRDRIREKTGMPARYMPDAQPEPVQMKNALMSRGPQMQFLPAHHGTPHKVDKFSTEKIGTGEGVQAYGWGLYFAENPKVAEEYQINLSGGMDKKPHVKEAVGKDVPDDAIRAAMMHTFTSGNTPDAARKARYMSIALRDLTDAEIFAVAEAGRKAARGNNYTVDIDATDNELLDWDKPLSEQSEKVKDAMRTIWKDLGGNNDPAANTATPGSNSGGSLYRRIAVVDPLMSKEELSRRLNALGIVGIKFLDQGSRDAKEGTRNYVVFDDSRIRITHENGTPITKEEKAAVLDSKDHPTDHKAAAKKRIQERESQMAR